jgi:hypothetical protein
MFVVPVSVVTFPEYARPRYLNPAPPSFRFPVPVKLTVDVEAEKCPVESSQSPETFHVFEPPPIVRLELVMVTVPEVKVTLFCVAVPAPEEASKVIVSVLPGVQPQFAAPDAVAQCIPSEKFPVPPTQKHAPPEHAAEALSVHQPNKSHPTADLRLSRSKFVSWDNEKSIPVTAFVNLPMSNVNSLGVASVL